MTLAPRPWAAELLHFWFHELSPGDWWRASDGLDETLRHRFLREWAALSDRPAREFLSGPQLALAAVLLFDQAPRNMFRGTARAFASDPLARAVTKGALERGFDRAIASDSRRQFLAMPL